MRPSPDPQLDRLLATRTPEAPPAELWAAIERRLPAPRLPAPRPEVTPSRWVPRYRLWHLPVAAALLAGVSVWGWLHAQTPALFRDPANVRGVARQTPGLAHSRPVRVAWCRRADSPLLEWDEHSAPWDALCPHDVGYPWSSRADAPPCGSATGWRLPDSRYELRWCDGYVELHGRDWRQPVTISYQGPDDWVAWTAGGYYTATARGEARLTWVHQAAGRQTTYPAAQFRRQRYRPEALRLLLQTGSIEQALVLSRGR